jgi:hypothetical protein
MEFGTITLIIPDTIYYNTILWAGYENVYDIHSKIIITYDNDPDFVKELDMTKNYKLDKVLYYYGPVPKYFTISENTFFYDEPKDCDNNIQTCKQLKSLYIIFRKHSNYSNHKSSIFNCVFYTHTYIPSKTYTFSLLKKSNNSFIFAYDPNYLNKTDLEKIVYNIFIPK